MIWRKIVLADRTEIEVSEPQRDGRRGLKLSVPMAAGNMVSVSEISRADAAALAEALTAEAGHN